MIPGNYEKIETTDIINQPEIFMDIFMNLTLCTLSGNKYLSSLGFPGRHSIIPLSHQLPPPRSPPQGMEVSPGQERCMSVPVSYLTACWYTVLDWSLNQLCDCDWSADSTSFWSLDYKRVALLCQLDNWVYLMLICHGFRLSQMRSWVQFHYEYMSVVFTY